jgi:hypothetical protein
VLLAKGQDKPAWKDNNKKDYKDFKSKYKNKSRDLNILQKEVRQTKSDLQKEKQTWVKANERHNPAGNPKVIPAAKIKQKKLSHHTSSDSQTLPRSKLQAQTRAHQTVPQTPIVSRKQVAVKPLS